MNKYLSLLISLLVLLFLIYLIWISFFKTSCNYTPAAKDTYSLGKYECKQGWFGKYHPRPASEGI